MKSGVGPVFPSPLEVPKDIHEGRLSKPTEALDHLQYVFDAINLTRHEVIYLRFLFRSI